MEIAELLPSSRNPLPLQNNLMKSLSADKEKMSSVAKIKVVVCSSVMCLCTIEIFLSSYSQF